MAIREIRVHSLGELIDHVTPRRPDEVTGRRRDSCVYVAAQHHGVPTRLLDWSS